MTFTRSLVILFPLLIVLSCLCINNPEKNDTGDVYSQVDPLPVNVKEKCMEDGGFIQKILSTPECLQGKPYTTPYGVLCLNHYYNIKIASKEYPGQNKEIYAPEDMQIATVGARQSSDTDCKNQITYYIKIGDRTNFSTVDMNCSEFYNYLNEYNKNCSNCLRASTYGCLKKRIA